MVTNGDRPFSDWKTRYAGLAKVDFLGFNLKP